MNSRSNRARARSILASVTAAALLVAGIAATGGVASGATASASAACSPPKYPGVGYFTSLSVSGVSCHTGAAVAKGYYRCRLRHGGVKGRCTERIYGFTCQERRMSIPTEIDARVTCVRGRASVVHTYQQDT
jgi:hypothetical protein